MESRRNFLKNASLLTAGSLIAGGVSSTVGASVPSKAKKVIGLQTYSLGRELEDDVPAGMKKIAQIGYSNLELAGYYDGKVGNVPVAEYRKMAEDAGVKITGSHVAPWGKEYNKYTKDNMDAILDFWKKVVADHVTLGVRSVVQPSLPRIETHDDVAIICEVFNKAGELTKAAGFRWGFHNHNDEFRRIAREEAPAPGQRRQRGDVIYDLLLNGTDPSLVFFEMDVYWTVMGQCDPLDYFEKFPKRFPILHIKDRSILGQSGMMNFENIFTKAYANGLDEYFVELEGVRNMSQFDGVKACYDYLAKASFVK